MEMTLQTEKNVSITAEMPVSCAFQRDAVLRNSGAAGIHCSDFANRNELYIMLWKSWEEKSNSY